MRSKFLMMIALLVGAGFLSGCIVEQPGYGNGDWHHHHHYDRD